MKCPYCQKLNSERAFRCDECDYGLAMKPKPKVTKARYLGDTGHETLDEELARTYRCGNCRSVGGRAKRSRLEGASFASSSSELIVVSCLFCGIVQMYDPEIVDHVESGWICSLIGSRLEFHG